MRKSTLVRIAVIVLMLGFDRRAGAEPEAGLFFAAHDGEMHEAPAPSVAVPAARDVAASAVVASDRPAPDRFFPNAGHVAVAGATGLGFAGLAEVAVGLSEGFTLGAVGGVTDDLKELGLGGRFQAALFRTRTVEALLTLPILYYPPSTKRQGEAWILAFPTLLLSGRPTRGTSVYGGVGLLAASCTEGLLAHFTATAQTPVAGRSPMVDGAWNTFNFGGAVATSDTTSLFLDTALIMSGFSLSQTFAHSIAAPVVAQVGWSVWF